MTLFEPMILVVMGVDRCGTAAGGLLSAAHDRLEDCDDGHMATDPNLDQNTS